MFVIAIVDCLTKIFVHLLGARKLIQGNFQQILAQYWMYRFVKLEGALVIALGWAAEVICYGLRMSSRKELGLGTGLVLSVFIG